MYYEFQNCKDFVSGNFRILGFQSLTSVNKAFQDGNDFQFANVENFPENAASLYINKAWEAKNK